MFDSFSDILTTILLCASGRIIAEKAIDIKHKLMEEQEEGTKLLLDLELVAFSKFKASMSWVDTFARVSGWRDLVSSQPVSISSVKWFVHAPIYLLCWTKRSHEE